MALSLRRALCLAGPALALALIGCGNDKPLPEIADVPAFTLTDQSAETLRTEDLKGKVWIANFVFTRCPTVCPLLTTQMSNVKRHLGEQPDLRFVSFSVDPDYDTPEVLTQYIADRSLDANGWHFLTGDNAAVRAAVTAGFKIHIGQPQETDEGAFDVLHGTHFVLVDKRGKVRGYFGSDGDGIAKLEQATRSLL